MKENIIIMFIYNLFLLSIIGGIIFRIAEKKFTVRPLKIKNLGLYSENINLIYKTNQYTSNRIKPL